jgi:Raf kinase inhibitor-like YbhB/YbcL family protein
MKNASEEKTADRRGFMKYSAAAVIAAAAAGVGYYALTSPPASSPTSVLASASTTRLTPRTTTVQPPAATSTTGTQTGLTVTSQAFRNGERIPSKYTCDGESVSPPIGWSGTPQETRSYALIMEDPDAPAGAFTHWVIFNIPAEEIGLQENVRNVTTLSTGAIQGSNGAGKIGYAGPCPPSGVHHYVFHVYALDTLLELQTGATKQNVLKAMEGHVLAEGQLTGLYSRG